MNIRKGLENTLGTIFFSLADLKNNKGIDSNTTRAPIIPLTYICAYACLHARHKKQTSCVSR